MCRWVAYSGVPVYLDEVISAPENSLVNQSSQATEGKSATNADGFGIGWYGGRDEPGTYRDTLPAWSDENLQSLSHQIRSHLFFAHVRASTGTRTNRSNCHPFANGKWLFMHNGQVGGFPCVRRQLESLIPDDLWSAREGTTDSEVLFLMLLGFGLDDYPEVSICRMIGEVARVTSDAKIAEPFRITAALSDGNTTYGIRYSTDSRAPGLYLQQFSQTVILASEPFDDVEERPWDRVPNGMGVKVGSNRTVSKFNLLDR